MTFRAATKPSDPRSSFYCRNVRGPGPGNRTCPEWQWASDEPRARTFLSATSPFWASFLPRREWAQGTPTPCPNYAAEQGEQPMFIGEVKSCTEELLCIPVLQGPFHQSLCCPHALCGWSPRTPTHISGPVTPWGCGKALVPDLNLSYKCRDEVSHLSDLSSTNYKMKRWEYEDTHKEVI